MVEFVKWVYLKYLELRVKIIMYRVKQEDRERDIRIKEYKRKYNIKD